MLILKKRNKKPSFPSIVPRRQMINSMRHKNEVINNQFAIIGCIRVVFI